MNNRHYILDGRKLVEVDLLTWSKWFETAGDKRRVARDTINGYLISTVFLGLDHNFLDTGKPLLFETMVFDTNKKKKYKLGDREMTSMGEDMEQERYETYAQAESGHKKIVEKYKKKQKSRTKKQTNNKKQT